MLQREISLQEGGVVQAHLHAVVDAGIFVVDHAHDHCALVAGRDSGGIVVGLAARAQDVELGELLALFGRDYDIDQGGYGEEYRQHQQHREGPVQAGLVPGRKFEFLASPYSLETLPRISPLLPGSGGASGLQGHEPG